MGRDEDRGFAPVTRPEPVQDRHAIDNRHSIVGDQTGRVRRHRIQQKILTRRKGPYFEALRIQQQVQ